MYGRNSYSGLQVRALAQPVDLLGLHRLSPQRYPFLLQSTVARPPLGRYDILFAFPGEALELAGNGELRGSRTAGATGFLAALDDWWRAEQHNEPLPELPFHGGWFLYLGYEKFETEDLKACAERQIQVCPATGANDVSVAEWVITTSMMLLRGAFLSKDDCLAGGWPRNRCMGR